MTLKRTPLYNVHKELGARLIDFGGWEMPVQYKDGIIKEHKQVRNSVGLFDVSHMGEAALIGPKAREAVQRLITNDVSQLSDGKALYSVMCYENGGIVDDFIVYQRSSEEFLIILNASNIEKDLEWIHKNVGSMVSIRNESEQTALIAVQGPESVALVDGLSSSNLADIKRFHFASVDVANAKSCMVARTGYTGEDGFEIACRAEDAEELWHAFLDEGAHPIGLGARDTLRLEARLCLYGNDIDQDTTPYEAALGWVVKPNAGDFIGKKALLAQKEAGIKRKLIGFKISERAIARPGYSIVDRSKEETDQVIGTVTSGTSGISCSGAIGMGYVPLELAKADTQLTIDCRGKDIPATVIKGPFYKRS